MLGLRLAHLDELEIDRRLLIVADQDAEHVVARLGELDVVQHQDVIETDRRARGGARRHQQLGVDLEHLLAVAVGQLQLDLPGLALLGAGRLEAHDQRHLRVHDRERVRAQGIEDAENVELAVRRHVGGVGDHRECHVHDCLVGAGGVVARGRPVVARLRSRPRAWRRAC